MNTPESHESYMRRALALAREGRATTRPNPAVGAVIVRDGTIVGEGYHACAGGPHAEIVALEQAGEAARGATMYVTLEPCNHHGRTPPCTEAILQAGIERVYFASRDTNPHVEGGGSRFLRDHGVDCIEDTLAEEANYLNRGFLHWTRTGRPWVIAKFAASLDGRIATRTGESQWITGPEARLRGHELRREVDAILVGSGTVIADDPLLTVRGSGFDVRSSIPEVPTVRIVVDGSGKSPVESKVFASAERVIHAGSHDRSLSTVVARCLARSGRRGRSAVTGSGWPDRSRCAARRAGQREIRSVLVEGGPTIHGSFFDARLVNEVWAFLAPIVIGGRDAPSAVAGTGITALKDALRLDSVHVEPWGTDVLVRGLVLDPRRRGDDAIWKDAPAQTTTTLIINH